MVSLLDVELLNESTRIALDHGIFNTKGFLKAIASSEDFVTKVAIAFGDNFDADSGLLLRFARITSHTLTICFFDKAYIEAIVNPPWEDIIV
jgi:DhnA family fructose-bisphosphate aldolase class Ia